MLKNLGQRLSVAVSMAILWGSPLAAQDLSDFEIPEFDLPEIILPELEPIEPLEPVVIDPVLEPPPVEEATRPTDLYGSEAAAVTDIEYLSNTDEDTAKDRAEELRAQLEAERTSQRSLESGNQRRSDEWAELAENAEADAAKNRERAQASRRDANAPNLSEDERQEFLRQATFWDDQARSDAVRGAERRETSAKSLRDAERNRDRIAFLNELIERLDAVINRESEEENQVSDAGAANTQPPAPSTEEPVRADYEMRLGQTLGIWRPDDNVSHVMVIVQKTPDSNSNALELHTQDRVWEGEYHVLVGEDARATKPRLTFTYTPKPDEMNPEIPAAARAAVEGELVWRIEAYESGSAANPALNFNFFRGRVRWKDEAPAEAEVDGDGPPKRFEARQDVVLATRLAAPTLLYVRLANQRHDPSLRSLDAITRGMPLLVNVIASSSSAKEIGSSLSVDVSSKTGGDTQLTLNRQSVTDDGRVVYGHNGVITIGGDGPRREFLPFSAPPRRIYGWIISALGIGELEPGPRLSVLPDNGDSVEFRFENAYHRMPVYASWVQRALAQYDDQINTMAATYGGMLASDKSAAEKKQIRDRLQMLANYQVLRRSGELTDKHRLAIAEAYLGRPNGRQLVRFSTQQLSEVSATRTPSTWLSVCGGMSAVSYARTLEAPDLQGREATSEEVGDALQRNALAFLGHTGINAVKALEDKDLNWVHPLELDCLDRVIVRVSRDLLNRTLKDYGTGLAFGLYEGIAMATGADDIAVAFFETDIYGNKVPAYSLPWWVSAVSVAVEVAGALDDAVSLGRKSAGDDIWQAAASDVADGARWSDELIDRNIRHVTRNVQATAAVGDDVRTIIRRADGLIEEVPEVAEEVLDTLPASLTTAQKKQTVVDLVPVDEVDEVMPVARSPRYTDQVSPRRGLADAAGNSLHDGADAPFKIDPETGVARWYGDDAKPFGQLGDDFCQIGDEHGCEGVSAAFMIFQEENVLMTEAAMHGEMMKAYAMRRAAEGVPARQAAAEFIDAAYGVTTGYHARDIAYYLRGRGYEVHAFNPGVRGRYTLAMLEGALEKGFRLRVGIRKPGQGGGHAVVVQSISRGRLGEIKDVVFFCPTQGGFLRMRAETFERWMIQDVDYDMVYATRRVNPPLQ